MRSGTVEYRKDLFNTAHSTRINMREGHAEILASVYAAAFPSVCFHCEFTVHHHC